MPLLSCSAQNCMFNTDRYCSKGDILVKGDHAQRACETCCSSFRERQEDSWKNYTGTPGQTLRVECTACDCRHNEAKTCSAAHVNITGASACCCSQTECSTFEKGI